MASPPVNYFYFENAIKSCISIPRKFDKSQKLIIGGGGLFGLWLQQIKTISNLSNFKVIWGAGLNAIKNIDYPSFVENFDLVGVRDYGQGLRWVPCASCLHSAFDKKYTVLHDIVIYEHHLGPINRSDFPKMSNNDTIENVIPFLGSSECVVTNTYHGVYWATLLGKKVIAIPLQKSCRFLFFKHPPKLVSEFSTNFSCVQSYDCLNECRQANVDFYNDVITRQV